MNKEGKKQTTFWFPGWFKDKLSKKAKEKGMTRISYVMGIILLEWEKEEQRYK